MLPKKHTPHTVDNSIKTIKVQMVLEELSLINPLAELRDKDLINRLESVSQKIPLIDNNLRIRTSKEKI